MNKLLSSSKHIFKKVISVIVSFVLLTGFSAMVQAEDLSEWQGRWVSAVSLLNTSQVDSELQSAYAEMGKKEGINAADWKANKLKRWNTAIKEVAIDQDSITFTLADGSQVTGRYTYDGSVNTQYGEVTLKWNKFSSQDQGAWQFIMLMEPEFSADRSGLTHFHFRYGNEGFDALQNASVFPTMVAPDTTAAQFAADFAE